MIKEAINKNELSNVNIKLVYGLILSLIVLVMFVLFSYSSLPETELIGSWDEIAWEYEKKETNDSSKDIDESIKDLIGKDLLIHQSEVWQFLPNGWLKLSNDQEVTFLQWRLKGRGNILQIKHSDFIENYNVTKLTQDTLELNFDSNIQARGIAKLVFIKNN